MVERVKITPSQILLKDIDGNIKFNTDNFYIKTGSGTLYAGGFDRAPAIYGQSTVTDHTGDGKFTPGLFTAATPFNETVDYKYSWNVPKADQVEFKLVGDWWEVNSGITSNTSRTLQFFNYDTRVLSNTSITYKWRVARIGQRAGGDPDEYGNYSYINQIYAAWPIFSTNNFPAVTNPNGGSYEVTWAANEHLSYYYTTVDDYGNTVYVYGSQFYTGQDIQWRANGLFSKRDAVALSLAVTP